MNSKLKNMPISLIITVIILLSLIVLINSVQISLGRYMSSFGGSLDFALMPKPSLDLTCGEWSEGINQQTLSINISNREGNVASMADGPVRIRLFIPKIDELSSVSINMVGREYVADVSAVPTGTVVYHLYGDGGICRFYGDDGAELSFDLSESADQGIDAICRLTSESRIDTTGIQILIEPVNTQGKGGN